MLISNYPTISIKHALGNYSTFSEQIAMNSSGRLKLFGPSRLLNHAAFHMHANVDTAARA
jgi:hypothetical protein